MTLGLALRFWINSQLKLDGVTNIKLLRAEQYKNEDTIPTQAAFDALLEGHKLVLSGHSMAHSIEYP